MTDATNLRDTIAPKSDRVNADDFLAGPETVTITAVKRGDADTPVAIHIQGRKPYYPCKSMRRVLITAWGDNGPEWVGKSMTLYTDPTVKFGGVAVGGIRISHLSHIENDFSMSLTVTKGKRSPYNVRRLTVAPAAPEPLKPYPADQFAEQLPKMRGSIESGKSTADKIVAYCLTIGTLTAEQEAAIRAPIAKPETTEEDVF
jgi:hypothetical protein